jgi:YVTN family beta-propeller protein
MRTCSPRPFVRLRPPVADTTHQQPVGDVDSTDPDRHRHGAGADQGGGIPDTIAFTPDGKTAYVLTTIGNADSGTVTPIRTATGTALPPIKVGNPGAMAITPDGKTAYVASDPDTVTPIRTATNTALAPIKVGHSPEFIVFTPDGKTAYVASAEGASVASVSGTVTPIRTAINTALTPIKAGRLPFAIAITKPRPSAAPARG